MNKRKRENGESASNSWKQRGLKHQLQQENLNVSSSANSNNGHPEMVGQTFYGTSLPCYSSLVSAEEKLKELNAVQRAYRIFAFDKNAEGEKMFVIGRVEDFVAICFHDAVKNRFSRYNYEVLTDGQPMKLYCGCKYVEAENPGKDMNKLLWTLLDYICQAYESIPRTNDCKTTLRSDNLLVETCHRDGKVYFHVKIPEQFGVITSMRAQRAFWSRVVTLASIDLQSGVDEDRLRAEELRAFRNWKGKLFDDWVVDFSVYNDYSRHFRNLRAAKHPKQSRCIKPQDYLVPLGKSLSEITEDFWKASLVMSATSDVTTLEIPKEWFEPNENTQGKLRAIQVFNSEFHLHPKNSSSDEEVRRLELDNNQFHMFSSFLKEIDAHWTVAYKQQLQVCRGYMNPKVDTLPKYIYLFPRTKYCPIKRGDHTTCCSWLKLSQDGTMIISCFSSDHNSGPNYKLYYNEDITLQEKDRVMLESWSIHKWMIELNSRYGFMKNPPVSDKCIVECHENSIQFHSIAHLSSLFTNCRAYNLHKNPKQAYDLPFDEQQQQSVLTSTNPFVHWLNDTNRRDVDRIICDPNSKGCAGDINTWRGFEVTPKQNDNPCPKLLNHIRSVLTSNNSLHYEFMLNWLSWIVQHPGEKSKIALVLVSDDGAGKHTFVSVLQKIFGAHFLPISESRRFFTSFNANARDKTLILLNESTWKEDKPHDDCIKNAISNDQSLIQPQFGRLESIKNYWNFIFVSNKPWCYPASEDNRLFFCPTVSNQHVGDRQYFDTLHGEIEKNGVAEFLHFLLSRQIPHEWTAAKCLPQSTRTHFEALMATWKNGALTWFISKLKQREWTEYVPVVSFDQETQNEPLTLISWKDTRLITASRLNDVWSIARENNRKLRKHTIGDVALLEDFFKKLFKGQKELFRLVSLVNNDQKMTAYEFGSMKRIRGFIFTVYGYSNWNDEEDEDSDGFRKLKRFKPLTEEKNYVLSNAELTTQWALMNLDEEEELSIHSVD